MGLVVERNISLKDQYKDTYFAVFILATLTCIVTVILRSGGIDFLEKSLWAEDGNVFINQAYQLGIKSLWTPYAGYLHLYPRFFSLIVKYTGLNFAPLIFFLGWVIAFLLMATLIIRKLSNYGISILSGAVVVGLIGLQPHTGEAYLTLTNAQWFLAIALTVSLLLNIKDKMSTLELMALPLICLTGPFSILLMPPMLIKAYIFKDFKKNIVAYSIIFLCASIQILFILNSERLHTNGIDTSAIHWILSVWIFLSFGDSGIVSIFSVFFWSFILFLLIYSIRRPTSNNVYNGSIVFLLIIASAVFYFAGLWTTKNAPLTLSPMGGGARYYIIPYSLIFITIPLITTGFHRNILLTTIFIICSFQFKHIAREELYFSHYVAFSQQKNNLIIPINPRWPQYPGWYIDTKNSSTSSFNIISPFQYNLNSLRLTSVTLEETDNGVLAHSGGNDPQILLDNIISCPDSNSLGVEFSIWREKEGWLQVFWDSSKSFSEKNSQRRYYPSGDVIAQFAFPHLDNGTYIRFDPMEQSGDMRIKKIEIYCLPRDIK